MAACGKFLDRKKEICSRRPFIAFPDAPPGLIESRYRNVVTGRTHAEKLQLCLGGLIADAMGLGKTLVTLSLIAGDLETQQDSKTSLGDTDSRPRTLVVTPMSSM